MNIRTKRMGIRPGGNIWIKSLILFGIEFQMGIYGWLSLRKIVFLVLCAGFLKDFFRRRGEAKVPGEVLGLLLSMAVLFGYACCIFRLRSVDYGDSFEGVWFLPRNIVFLTLNAIVFPALLAGYFQDALQFCRAQWNITLFQAAVAVMGKLNKAFALYIYHNFYKDDGRFLDGVRRGVRVVCIDTGGATASVIFFAGLVCALCLLFYDLRSNPYALLAQYCFVLFSLFFIGRTGLYLGIAGLILAVGCLFIKRKPLSLWMSCVLAVLLGLLAGYLLLAPESYMKAHYVKWIGELFVKGAGEGSTIAALAEMEIPPLTEETFWGTGIVYGVARSGVRILHDSGYVRMYAALGIPGFLLYYGGLYGFYTAMLLKIRKKRDKWVLWLLFLGVAVCEYKEPFLGKTPLTVIMTCLFMLERSGLRTGGACDCRRDRSGSDFVCEKGKREHRIFGGCDCME